MANFDADTLHELRHLQEIAIRTEKHPKNAVVIWVAVADDEVFVRSVRGTKGRWYRDLAAGGPATLEFAGRRLAVQAIPASDPAAVGRASREYLSEVPAGPLPQAMVRVSEVRVDPSLPLRGFMRTRSRALSKSPSPSAAHKMEVTASSSASISPNRGPTV